MSRNPSPISKAAGSIAPGRPVATPRRGAFAVAAAAACVAAFGLAALPSQWPSAAELPAGTTTLARPAVSWTASIQDAPDAPPSDADPFAEDPFAEDAPARPVDVSASDVRYDPAADTFQVHVSDADLLDVLRMLSLQGQRNIIASRDVRGTVTANLYDVTVEEALDAILRSHGYVAREEGNFIYIYTREEFRQLQDENRRQETRVFRVFHLAPTSAARMIEPSLSEGAVISFSDDPEIGLTTSQQEAGGYTHSGGDVIVIRDFPEHLVEVERLLQEIDRRPEQVLIEATILSTKLTENNQLGVDFNIVGGVDFASVMTSNGQVTGASLEPATPEVYGGGTGNNFTSGIPGGVRVGLVTNNVSAFIAALEGVTDTTVLANPKVLALNKQRGEVLVGRQDGYITTTLTETVATQRVEFLETGTKLVFRPFISRDGYIRLEIHPEDSQGGLNAANLPFKTTTEVTSNVMVRDGRTIVIGGLFRESTNTNRAQVPVLGNLPLLGHAFRRQGDFTEREEIIILLTPHIVKDHDHYARLSEEELRRAEKVRVGTRKGMMPTGRERLSQMYYEKAVREMAKDRPNTRRAIFWSNAATNLNPTFIEAIELRERLTGRVVVEADQSTIRSFVRRAMLDEVTPLKPDRDQAVPSPQDLMGPALPPLRPAEREFDQLPRVVPITPRQQRNDLPAEHPEEDSGEPGPRQREEAIADGQDANSSPEPSPAPVNGGEPLPPPGAMSVLPPLPEPVEEEADKDEKPRRLFSFEWLAWPIWPEDRP